MDSAGYIAVSRQSGLTRELQLVANNIANISTTGFRREGIVFAEHVSALRAGPSLSQAHANGRMIDLSQAGLSQTGGTFDLAIQGEGFFLMATPMGDRLTRAGQFTPSVEGALLSPDGFSLLDAGGAPVFVPPNAQITIGQDGTLSADGIAVTDIALWRPTDKNALRHEAGTLFSAAELEPVENPVMLQGFLEDSNVNPVLEIARLIEVQRAYEAGQKFLDAEDNRSRNVIQTLGR